jgi:outer membrane murein-binding lipoprotein Lpp
METTNIYRKLMLIPILLIAVILVSGCVSSGAQDKFKTLEQLENQIADKMQEVSTTASKLETRMNSYDTASINSAIELNTQMQTQLNDIKTLVKEAQGITADLDKEKLSGSVKTDLETIKDMNNHILAGTENFELASQNIGKSLDFARIIADANKAFDTAASDINFGTSALYAGNTAEAKTKLAAAKSGLQSAKTKYGQASNVIYFKFTVDMFDVIDKYDKCITEYEQAVSEASANDKMGAYGHEVTASSYCTAGYAIMPAQSAIDTEIGMWMDQNIYVYTDKALDEFGQIQQKA